MFQNASMIVAPHGAALSNLVAVPEGCTLIELNGDRDIRWHYQKIARDIGIESRLVIGEYVNSLSFSIEPARVLEVIMDLK